MDKSEMILKVNSTYFYLFSILWNHKKILFILTFKLFDWQINNYFSVDFVRVGQFKTVSYFSITYVYKIWEIWRTFRRLNNVGFLMDEIIVLTVG